MVVVMVVVVVVMVMVVVARSVAMLAQTSPDRADLRRPETYAAL